MATYVSDPVIRDLTERNLEVAIGIILDIGNHVIADYGWESPDKYGQVFAILAEHGVIPQTFAERSVGMANFRNILVHEYTKIDHRTVYNILQTKLSAFEEFARYLVAWLEQETTSQSAKKKE